MQRNEDTTDASKELVPIQESGIVQAAASVEELKAAMEIYQKLLKELLDETDVVAIKEKKYIKKSGWLKLAKAFNLSIKVIDERKEIFENPKGYAYHITVRCIAPNGREVEDLGSCDTSEKTEDSEHVIRTMAKTRATSRVIAAMIGASESPAEDMEAAKSDSHHACKCKGGSTCEKNSRTCTKCGGKDLS